MQIQDFIARLLKTLPSDGWGQMSRKQIIGDAVKCGVDDPELCADACDALGIGELEPGESASKVTFKIERIPVQSEDGYRDDPLQKEQIAAFLERGSLPVRAMVWHRGERVAYGLLSWDYCSPAGQIEHHLSVSASAMGVGRTPPTEDEVNKAIAHAGLSLEKVNFIRDADITHAFQRCRVEDFLG